MDKNKEGGCPQACPLPYFSIAQFKVVKLELVARSPGELVKNTHAKPQLQPQPKPTESGTPGDRGFSFLVNKVPR